MLEYILKKKILPRQEAWLNGSQDIDVGLEHFLKNVRALQPN